MTLEELLSRGDRALFRITNSAGERWGIRSCIGHVVEAWHSHNPVTGEERSTCRHPFHLRCIDSCGGSMTLMDGAHHYHAWHPSGHDCNVNDITDWLEYLVPVGDPMHDVIAEVKRIKLSDISF